MRALVLSLVTFLSLVESASAVAQTPGRLPPVAAPSLATPADPTSAIWAQQRALDEMARQQAIARANELTSLEAQIRTEQNLRNVPGLQLPARIPIPDVSGPGPYPQIDTSQLASIPDSVLADSNKKVLAAAANRP